MEITFLVDKTTIDEGLPEKIREILREDSFALYLESPESALFISDSGHEDAPPFYLDYDDTVIPNPAEWGWWPCAWFVVQCFLWTETNVPMESPVVPNSWDISTADRRGIHHNLRKYREMTRLDRLAEMHFQYTADASARTTQEVVHVSKEEWLQTVLLSDSLHERREGFKLYQGLAYK